MVGAPRVANVNFKGGFLTFAAEGTKILVCWSAVDASAGTVADEFIDGLLEDMVRHHGGRGMLMWILWIMKALIGSTGAGQLDFFKIQNNSCVGSVLCVLALNC